MEFLVGRRDCARRGLGRRTERFGHDHEATAIVEHRFDPYLWHEGGDSWEHIVGGEHLLRRVHCLAESASVTCGFDDRVSDDGGGFRGIEL